MFESPELTPSNIDALNMKYSENDFRSKPYVNPVVCECIIPDTKSVWLFDGNEKDVSILKEVTIQDRQLTVHKHVPSPTCYVAAGFRARLSADYLAKKREITKYMWSEEQQAEDNSSNA